MIDFQIGIEEPGNDKCSEPDRLRIRLGDSVLTRLVRRGSNAPDDWLEAPPVPLAFWFIDNWWRIRWEPTPHRDLNAEWRLAHHLSSVGAGYHWPNVSIWGEGSRVGVAVHADANNLKSSLKFVAKPRLDYVPSSIIEDAIDRFVRAVLESVGDASDGLGTEYRQLQSERTEPSVAAWRKLEAMLGFDPDDAPDGLVARMEALSAQYGSEPLQEAALAHQGKRAAEALDNCIHAAKSSNVLVRSPLPVETIADPAYIDRSSFQPPCLLGSMPPTKCAIGSAYRRDRYATRDSARLSGQTSITFKPNGDQPSVFPTPCGYAKKRAADSPCDPPGRTRGGSNSAEASATSSGPAMTTWDRCPQPNPSARSSKEPSPKGSSAHSTTFGRTSTPTSRARTTSMRPPVTSTFLNA